MIYDTKGIEVYDSRGCCITAGRFITDDTRMEAKSVSRHRGLAFSGILPSPNRLAYLKGVNDFLDRNGVRDVWDSMDCRQHGLVYAAFAYAMQFSEGLIPKLPKAIHGQTHAVVCEGTYSTGLGKARWVQSSKWPETGYCRAAIEDYREFYVWEDFDEDRKLARRAAREAMATWVDEYTPVSIHQATGEDGVPHCYEWPWDLAVDIYAAYYDAERPDADEVVWAVADGF